jgi:alpha-1,6-mannosyltransferase
MLSRANFPSSLSIENIYRGLLAVIFAISVFCIDFLFDQMDFFSFFPLYTLAFISLILLYKSQCSWKFLLLLGIVSRVSLIFIFPGLSDDIYRFYWDGRLVLSGISPYGVLPEDVLNKNLPYLDQTLFDLLNSQQYYTIYPPISQLYYALSALMGDVGAASVTMKTLFLITESIGVVYLIRLLKKVDLPVRLFSLYFLNPLVIIEGVGNLHYEVLMISFICISIYYTFNNKIIYGALWMSVSIGIKLLPLMVLPYFWFRMRGKDKLIFFSSLVGFLIIIFLPMASSVEFVSFLSSVDLYFRKFEFNAGIYYTLRYIGEQISGYNLIRYLGPSLGLITVGCNFYLAAKNKIFDVKSFLSYGLLAWTGYLLLATTVHPWYVISILFFGIFTSFRYAFIWSYLIFISYVNYSYSVYYENLWWIALEYFVLLVYIFLEVNIRQIKVLTDRTLDQPNP